MSASVIELLTLRNLKEVGEAALRHMTASRGSLEGILDASFEDLVYIGFDLRAAEAIQGCDRRFAEKEIKRAEAISARIITIYSPDYPALLKQIYDPPLCLYVMGDISCLDALCVAIVGARKSSNLGRDMAAKLAADLAGCGLTVVSGLAYGIDIDAHLAAVKADGSTAAVLGSGLANIYPKAHKVHVAGICRKGCIITEFPMDEEPNAYNFPRRNRIISGLCRGITVVEASSRSGSLITARMALEQGREVFAVPASPMMHNNATNDLITNGATFTESYLDILKPLAKYLEVELQMSHQEKMPEFSSPDEATVYTQLATEPANIDELMESTALSYDSVILALTSLEVSGSILKSPDGRYRAKVL